MDPKLFSVIYATTRLAGPFRITCANNAQARMLINVVLTIRESNRF